MLRYSCLIEFHVTFDHFERVKISMTIELPNLPPVKIELKTTRILCIGSPGIGKTAILKALCDPRNVFDGTGDGTSTTVDFYAVNARVNPSTIRRFCFFDTGGAECLSHIRLELINDADGLLMFYSDKASFLALESRWLVEAKDVVGKIPIITCGIRPSPVPDRQATSWADTRKITHVSCSPQDTAPLLKCLIDTFRVTK